MSTEIHSDAELRTGANTEIARAVFPSVHGL